MAQAPGDGAVAQGLEACGGYCRFRFDIPDSLQADIVACRVECQIGPDARAANHFDLVEWYARQVGQIAFQSVLRIGAGDGGRGGDEADLLGLPAEGLDHPAQQQGHFRRLRAYIGVCLIKDDPAQRFLLPGNLQDRVVDLTHQHVLKHGGVGHQDRRRFLAQQFPRQDLVRLLLLFLADLVGAFFGLAVVQAEADVAAVLVGPGVKALLLRVDQGIERVEEQGADAH